MNAMSANFSRVFEWHFIFVDIFEYCEHSNEEGS